MHPAPLILTLLLLVVAVPAAHAETTAAIRAPFDVGLARSVFGSEDTRDFTCTAPPAPVVDVEVTSVYRQGVAGNADVDPEREQKYNDATGPVRDFNKSLIKFANLYVRSSPPRADYAQCAVSWLAAWGRGNAFLGKTSSQGQAVRKWNLAVVASAYLQIRDEPSLAPDDRAAALDWIRRLADQAYADYSSKTELASRNSNHLYWAAWGVGLASVVLNDRTLFDFAMAGYRRGIEQIEPDGTLPLEMARHQRALSYHMFAIVPLVMIAELGEANGVDLYAEREGAVHRLIRATIDGIADPALFVQRSGYEQEMPPVATPAKLTWLVPYSLRFPAQQWNEMIAATPSLNFTRLGGNVRLLYGRGQVPEAAPDEESSD